MARIEVLPAEFEKLLEHREEIVTAFKKFGFTYVTMDLQGYRTGSMNETLDPKLIADTQAIAGKLREDQGR